MAERVGTARKRLILEENSEKTPECHQHEDQGEESSGKAKGMCKGLGLQVLAAFKEQKAGKGISYWGGRCQERNSALAVAPLSSFQWLSMSRLHPKKPRLLRFNLLALGPPSDEV